MALSPEGVARLDSLGRMAGVGVARAATVLSAVCMRLGQADGCAQYAAMRMRVLCLRGLGGALSAVSFWPAPYKSKIFAGARAAWLCVKRNAKAPRASSSQCEWGGRGWACGFPKSDDAHDDHTTPQVRSVTFPTRAIALVFGRSVRWVFREASLEKSLNI